jgi:hypothetical protein
LREPDRMTAALPPCDARDEGDLAVQTTCHVLPFPSDLAEYPTRRLL